MEKDLVDNRFEVVKHLGRGLTAKVKLVLDRQDGGLYAMKIFVKKSNSTITAEKLA